VNETTSAVCVKRLDLSNFRNYRDLHLQFDRCPVVLTGANGAGKTNLLEALSMLLPGRGMRGAGFDAMLALQAEARQWAVSAIIDGPDGEVRMGTSWQPRQDGSGQTRRAQINGEKAAGISAFAEHVRLIWLTPAMDRLFAGPAGDRRRFLDRIVSGLDLAHRRALNSFDKLMRERNMLLSQDHYDASWLSVLEQQMAEQAIAIAAARLAAIDTLQGHINAAQEADGFAVFPAARLMLDGQIEASLRNNPAVQSEDEYVKMLHDSRKIDQAAGRTLNGPHRSDLIVFHKGKDMEARSCSTGEQKALLTGLVLAQARMVRSVFFGTMPLLLLDEIAAHLDRDRRRGLFEELTRTGAQSWMTGTDEIQFEALRGKAQFLTVNDGQIQQD
jgi:DNA replication and repair protein RecF